jgi:hypothetical protein
VKTGVLEKNLFKCHFVHHKFYRDSLGLSIDFSCGMACAVLNISFALKLYMVHLLFTNLIAVEP